MNCLNSDDMDRPNLIPVQTFCRHHRIAATFIRHLKNYDLIELVEIEREPYLREEQLQEVEKLMRLHYDLNINMEGLDALRHLLRRNEQLQEEVRVLRNKLEALG